MFVYENGLMETGSTSAAVIESWNLMKISKKLAEWLYARFMSIHDFL